MYVKDVTGVGLWTNTLIATRTRGRPIESGHFALQLISNGHTKHNVTH